MVNIRQAYSYLSIITINTSRNPGAVISRTLICPHELLAQLGPLYLKSHKQIKISNFCSCTNQKLYSQYKDLVRIKSI